MGERCPIIKVAIIGANYCGKSCLSVALVNGMYEANQPATISPRVLQKNVELNKQKVTVRVCDTDGEERFESLTSLYYKRADAILVCYDVAGQSTFDRVRYWASEAARNTLEHTLFYLVACKCDLKEEAVITAAGGRQAAENLLGSEKEVKFFETSSKNYSNIEELLNCVVTDVMNNEEFHHYRQQQDQRRLNISQNTTERKRVCC